MNEVGSVNGVGSVGEMIRRCYVSNFRVGGVKARVPKILA